MVSLSYSAPTPNDPIFVRTNFLGRVASDGLGLDYQHDLLKRSSSTRNSDLHRWDATWLAPVTHAMSYDSDESSVTDDDILDRQHAAREPVHHLRSRSSTLPHSSSWTGPVEMARARSMTAPPTASASSSSSSSFEARSLRQKRSTIGSGTDSRLMPARPLSINTAQPLRLSVSGGVPDPIATVGPSPKTCSPPVVRIEHSESDGSCHGDAGDQDPEAQLAAGIIRLREQRKSQRRGASKRRVLAQSSRADIPSSTAFDDADSDDAQSMVIRKAGGNFVLRLAEIVLDFGSSALEKLAFSDAEDLDSPTAVSSDDQQSSLQTRRRSSTTPQELSAEAGELLRRRRQRVSSQNTSDSSSSDQAQLKRSWSVPKLLSLPLFSPHTSLKVLQATTASTPTTPLSGPAFGFTKISDEPQLDSFNEVGASYTQQVASLYSHSSTVSEVISEPGHVSPLWRK